MRKLWILLMTLILLASSIALMACGDSDDDSIGTTQSFTIDDGDLTLEISDLKVVPKEKSSWTESEKNFNVTVRVRNVGITSGTYSAVLLEVFDERETMNTEEVFLESGADETISFLLVKENPGTYQLELGELKSEFQIKTRGNTLNIIIGSIIAIALFLFLVRLIPVVGEIRRKALHSSSM